MNYNPSTYPLQLSDEILFQISPSTPFHQQRTLQVIPPVNRSNDNNDDGLSFKLAGKGRGRGLSSNDHQPNDDGGESEEMTKKKKKKKIMHREVERQRRQEMATLYRTIRSLLPFEYLQGKRSISDHMGQVINYIKHKKKKIKELSERRHNLKISSNSGTSDQIVMVQPCQIGMEVAICSSSRDERVLPLSAVLELLVEEGLSVVSCVSTKVNGNSIYTIQSKISTEVSIGTSGLQQKLTNLGLSASQIQS